MHLKFIKYDLTFVSQLSFLNEQFNKVIWSILKEKHQDLIDFLKDAFTMRNNIAHPEEFTAPKYISSHLYDGIPSKYHLGKLKEYIQIYFKEFLWFLLKIWIEKKIITNEQWFSYLETLKTQILNERNS